MNTIQCLIDQINSKKFLGLEMYDIGSALPMMAANICYNSKMTIKSKIRVMVQWVLFDTVICQYSTQNADTLLIYSDERIKRADYQKIFENVKDTLCADTVIAEKKNRAERRSFKEMLLRTQKAFQWMRQLWSCGIDIRNSLRVVTDIMRIYDMHRYLEASSFLHKKRDVIVFCDIFPTDNISVQYFKQRRIPTMTLQHAAFTAPLKKPTNINDAGIELTYSISDYFLGWSLFTKNEAIRSGMKEQKFRIAGIPQFINHHAPDANENKHNCFGVILGVKEYDDVNRNVVRIANEISEKYNLKYYLKYHPNFKGDEYAPLVNDHCLGAFPSREISQYIENVDFSILSITSMLIEFVYLGHEIYRYKVDPERDKFSQIDVCSFEDLQGFSDIYGQSQKGLFEYLCYTHNVAGSYRQVVKDILNGEDANEWRYTN